jgi:putative ABC transport system permease protein
VTWWKRLLRRSELDVRLDQELRDHIERRVADEVAAGISEAEARRQAMLELGGLEQTKEACREVRGTRWLDELAHDLRYASRLLAQSPVFTLVAVLSLALGIGTNTALFSVVDSLILKTLPVREPGRLALLDDPLTYAAWEQIRDRQTDLFDGAVAWDDDRSQLNEGGQVESVQRFWVSGTFFDVLGVSAILGRTFTSADDRRGGGPDGPVTLISHRFWQERFGGAPDVIGHTLILDHVAFTVIGVTEPRFFGPMAGRSFDVALPLGSEPLVRPGESHLDSDELSWLQIMVRVKPGQTVSEATTALRGVQPQIRKATLPNWPAESLESYLREPFSLVPAASGSPDVRNRYQRPLLTMMVVAGLVLLIACTNIANLLLARSTGRQREFSMRLALGASRLRLARQLLTESLLLAGIGGTLGLAIAHWGSQLLVRQISTSTNIVILDLSLDWRLLGFAAAAATGTALLFGITPALRAGRVQPNEALKEQGLSLMGDRRRGLGGPLLVTQVALSLVLLVAAGLFIRTFSTLATRDLGFDRDTVLVVRIDPGRSHVKPEERAALFERVTEAAAAVPGVARAAVSSVTPIGGLGFIDRFHVSDTAAEETLPINAITPGWFATYGTTLIAGRDFDARDHARAARVAIVNQAFARKYMNGANPVGRQIGRTEPGDERPAPLLIVGLVEDAAYGSPRDTGEPSVYLPMAQQMASPMLAHISIRAAVGSPALLTKSVAAAISEVDPKLSLSFRPLADHVNAALVQERVVALLSGFFGALALLLAGIGLYGIASYAVGRRRTEIGIRMALGADAVRVVQLVLGRVAILMSLGIVIGAAVSLWASRFVEALLYGLEPHDRLTLVTAVAVLASVGALAGWLPARRAARIDPARVLREG